MKKYIAIAGLLALAACNNGTDKAASGKAGALDSEMAKFSYSVGLDVGKSLGGIGKGLDMDAFNKGVDVGLNGKESELTAKEISEVKQAVIKRKKGEFLAKRKKLAGENKSAGGKFLQENASADGVKTTDSGLQYKVLKAGDGAKPTLNDVVKVNYEGRLLNDTVFDSSYKRGQPVSFPLKSVIPGWQEGLQLMPVGSKYRLFIPAKLAYGEQGAGNVIGPNSVLKFDVELISIETPKAAKK